MITSNYLNLALSQPHEAIYIISFLSKSMIIDLPVNVCMFSLQFEHIAKVLKSLPAFKASNEERLLGVTYQLYITFQELRQLSQTADRR